MFRKILSLCLLMTLSTSVAHAEKAQRYCQGGLKIAENGKDIDFTDYTTPNDYKALENPKAHLGDSNYKFIVEWGEKNCTENNNKKCKKRHLAKIMCTDAHTDIPHYPIDSNGNISTVSDYEYGAWQCIEQKYSGFEETKLHKVETDVDGVHIVKIKGECIQENDFADDLDDSAPQTP